MKKTAKEQNHINLSTRGQPVVVLPSVQTATKVALRHTPLSSSSEANQEGQYRSSRPVKFLEPLAAASTEHTDTHFPDEATSCFISESETQDEMLSLSTSTVVSCPALRIGAEWGASASSLIQADIVRNQKLRKQLAELRLSDFFNVHGEPHFKKLSISFAVKQNHDVGDTFGSTGDLHASASEFSNFRIEGDVEAEDEKGTLGSSKAFLAASEARAKDLLMTREKADALLRKVTDGDRLRTADVDRRRLNLLFAEIPSFETFLPHEIDIKDLMPADLLEEEEVAEKESMERQNAFLADKNFIEGSQMSWLFPQSEVLVISQCLQRWSVSTRGSNLMSTAGMDRPTFCRLLFDLDLVGDGVPYFWAVSLFDSLAQPMRSCTNADHSATAPLHHIVTLTEMGRVMEGDC